MMRKLDQRGVAALEFCLVAVPFFTLMFAIFDLGRYAITRQSLRALANAGAREIMVQRGNLVDAEGPISCYAYGVKHNNLPTVCTGDPLPSRAEKEACCPVPVCWRSHAYTERAAGCGSTYFYGISTRFHHDNADMGHRIERAERVHLSSVLAHS